MLCLASFMSKCRLWYNRLTTHAFWPPLLSEDKHIYLMINNGIYWKIKSTIPFFFLITAYDWIQSKYNIFNMNIIRGSYVKGIATQIIWSSSRSGWTLRNIHISNDNGSFPFTLVFSISYSTDKTFIRLDYICG